MLMVSKSLASVCKPKYFYFSLSARQIQKRQATMGALVYSMLGTLVLHLASKDPLLEGSDRVTLIKNESFTTLAMPECQS